MVQMILQEHIKQHLFKWKKGDLPKHIEIISKLNSIYIVAKPLWGAKCKISVIYLCICVKCKKIKK